MTIERIEKLSKNLSGLIDKQDSVLQVDQVYYNLVDIRKKYNDYFMKMSFQDFIKLTFYIWSYINTGNFKLGQKYLNNIFFVGFFLPDAQKYDRECDECGGDGRADCSYCRYGEVNCDECEGTGNLECPECDGDGRQMGDGKWENCEECGGSGEIKCEECDGGGEVSCNECGGSGREDCNTCDGGGIIETDENLYRVETFISWNPELKSISELKYEDNSPIGDEEFSRLTSKNSFLISQDDSDGELRDFVSTEDQYVYYYSDEGEELIFSSSGNVINSDDPTSYLID